MPTDRITDKVLCPSCGQEIDPDWCCCGNSRESHSGWEGHRFVPMGCVCFYERKQEPERPDAN